MQKYINSFFVIVTILNCKNNSNPEKLDLNTEKETKNITLESGKQNIGLGSKDKNSFPNDENKENQFDVKENDEKLDIAEKVTGKKPSPNDENKENQFDVKENDEKLDIAEKVTGKKLSPNDENKENQFDVKENDEKLELIETISTNEEPHDQVIQIKIPEKVSKKDIESEDIIKKGKLSVIKIYKPGLNILLECENKKCKNLAWICKGFGMHNLEQIRDDYKCLKCKGNQKDTNIIKKLIAFNSNYKYNILCRTNKSDGMISSQVMEKELHGPRKRIQEKFEGKEMEVYDLSDLIKLLSACYYAKIQCTSII